MRVLDQRGISYRAYEYDPALKSAEEVAAILDMPEDSVYKTLVMLREGGRPVLVMAPGGSEVDLRVLAKSLGCKAVRMAPRTEAERLTGLQTGGIGALALLGKSFDVFIDRRALECDFILVNAGRRGLNLGLRPADLVRVTGAVPVDVS
jgi:Cys-tRNA(Pro)/Cys-tRNA(Cys) deacylase